MYLVANKSGLEEVAGDGKRKVLEYKIMGLPGDFSDPLNQNGIILQDSSL